MKQTPTGIPIRLCELCGIEHPVTRDHCRACGRPSLFIDDGLCLVCREAEELGTTRAHVHTLLGPLVRAGHVLRDGGRGRRVTVRSAA